jgi:hypothetical protein
MSTRHGKGERGNQSQLHAEENILGTVQTVRLEDARSRATRLTLALIVISAIARIVLAWLLGLGVDESYEVVQARVPSLGYFDHPPLSFWIAGSMARVFGTEQRVVLRLPFILLFAVTTWLLFRLTARLYGERAGFVAALLLNVAPVFGLSTGGWILPDGPLACAMVTAAYCLSRLFVDSPEEQAARVGAGAAWRWWLAAGLATGFALLSKYHGVFLLAGTLLFVATRREARFWLARSEPYVAVALALFVMSPAIIWNAEHEFASFRFQAGRATSHGLHLTSLLQNLAGQLGYLLPWIGVSLLWQLARGLRGGPRDAGRWLLCCLAAGPITVFTLIALGGNPGLPHWPAPGYLLLFPLLGDAVVRYEARGAREHTLISRFLVATVLVFVMLTGIAASAVATGWPMRLAPNLFRRGDPTLEAIDWRDLRSTLKGRGLLPDSGGLVITTHWIDAAKVGYALGPSVRVVCFSDDPRGFQYTYPPINALGRDALIIAPEQPSRSPLQMVARVAPYVRSIEPLPSVPITRAGGVVMRMAVFQARDIWRPYSGTRD